MGTLVAIMLATALGFAQAQPAQQAQSAQPAGAAAERAQTMLQDSLQDKNPDVRKEAAIALSLNGPSRETLQSLGSMLDDSDVQVRLATVSTLGDFNDRRTIPLLEKALDDPVAEVDFASAKVLYRLHRPDAEQFLLAVVAGESKAKSGFIASHARSVLRMAHTPMKLATTAGETVAGMVVPVPGIGLGISSVEGILLDPGASPRAGALLLLAHDTNPAVHDEVRDALSDKDWSLRAAAAHLIAVHPYPDLRAGLVPLLDDKRDAVRLRAAVAYLKLGRPPAVSQRKGARTHKR